MEAAIKEKSSNLSYCYYIYKVNVTKNNTEFSSSRMNGQLLAQKFAVPDIIDQKCKFAIDVHYSDDSWGVKRFIFTPRKNNIISYNLGKSISNTFDWIDYYAPSEASSPEYVTTPLNEGGIPAVVYEAYTNDTNDTTLNHDYQIIDYVDKYDFNNTSLNDSNVNDTADNSTMYNSTLNNSSLDNSNISNVNNSSSDNISLDNSSMNNSTSTDKLDVI